MVETFSEAVYASTETLLVYAVLETGGNYWDTATFSGVIFHQKKKKKSKSFCYLWYVK